jgi:trimeric autotransporter adhesin
MNPLPHFKQTILPILVPIVLACFGFLPRVQAVVPAPDGGYPGGNTAEGQSALFSLTTGGYNTAVGYLSLSSNNTNGFNTAVGAGTLLLNTADQNTATGAGALLSNTTGTLNTANGAFALFNNTTGIENSASGYEALFSNTIGGFNAAFGVDALYGNTTGIENTAYGDGTLLSNTTGNGNTAIGEAALRNSVDQGYSTAVGYAALLNATAGPSEAFGHNALYSDTTGSGNTAIGEAALYNNTTGFNNVALGGAAGSNVTTAHNVICIGTGTLGADVDNSCFIGSIFGVTSSGGTAVFINSNGQLGTVTSSRRFKENIKPMDKASEALFALKPVSFRYKKEIDPVGISRFGLVAEDVEKVNPDLVVRDKDGQPYSVRYDQVNAMLLNEFLKEHRAFIEEQRKVEKLEAIVAQQHKDFEAAVAELKGQIQKVGVQLATASPSRGGLELSKSAPQTVLNNR